MKRPLGITLLVLIVSLVRPAPASAGFWAWLEDWSGPGPFRAKPYQTVMLTYCVQDQRLKPSPISNYDASHEQMAERATLLEQAKVTTSFADGYKRILAAPTLWDVGMRANGVKPDDYNRWSDKSRTPEIDGLVRKAESDYFGGNGRPSGAGHADKHLICAFTDVVRFSAPADRGYPDLTATSFDVGTSARLHDGVDLGVGFGRISFRGADVHEGYWTLTPVRLVIRPILLALPEEKRRGWMGLFNLYWKETYVKGPIRARDLGAPQLDWTVQGELIRSFGVNIDVGTLFPTNFRRPGSH
jgi:hypothetical protein